MNTNQDITNKPIPMDYEHYELLKQIKNIDAIIKIVKIINPDNRKELIHVLTQLRTDYKLMIIRKLFPITNKDCRKDSHEYMHKRMMANIEYIDRQKRHKQQELQLCIEEYNQADIAVTYEQYELFEQINKINTFIESLTTSSPTEYAPNTQRQCHELLTELKKNC